MRAGLSFRAHFSSGPYQYQFVYDQIEIQRDGGARVASSTEMTWGRNKEISKRQEVSAPTGRIWGELYTIAEGWCCVTQMGQSL